MNQDKHDELLIKTSVNAEIAANGIIRLEKWATDHQKEDNDRETRAVEKHEALNLKVQRIIWTWGVISFLAVTGISITAIPAVARAFGLN